MNTISEVLKDLFYLLSGNYEDGLATNLDESGRRKISTMLDCSLIELDIAITKLKVSKKIVVQKHFVVEVK